MYNQFDMNLILKSIEVATLAHGTTPRKWTKDIAFVIHPIRVMNKINNFFSWEKEIWGKFDGKQTEMLVIAALHDVLEDTEYSAEDIVSNFGKEVLTGVECLTNPSKQFPKMLRKERKQMDFEHIAKIPEHLQVIKAFDRIDNLYDMVGARPQFILNLYVPESIELAKLLNVHPKIKECLDAAINWIKIQTEAEVFNGKNHKAS